MLIDWFTVAAQIVNFLILVVLLKVFLYDRIVEAMDRREQKIADRLTDAEEKQKTAERQAEEYRRKINDFEKKKDRMLREAREQVDEQRQSWQDEARREIDDRKTRWRDEIERQRDALIEQVTLRAGRSIVETTRRALSDLADERLEHQIVRRFEERIGSLGDNERSELDKALNEADGRVTVTTSLELADDTKDWLRNALAEQFQHPMELVFETSGDLVAGIEIEIAGRALGWNVYGYLDALEQQVSDALQEQASGGGRKEDGSDRHENETAGEEASYDQ